jgi:hypothetical protein
MYTNTLFYILLFLPLLTTMGSLSPVTIQTQPQGQKQTQTKETHFSLNIVSMVNDYTLVNKVLEPFININTEPTTFSLKEFKERETRDRKKSTTNINVLNDWLSYFTTGTGINIETDSFEIRIQNHVDLLNHVIINATDGLLNMCDKMIAKTTSSLPLSYSSYALFETEMRLKNVNLDHDDSDDSNSNSKKNNGMFGFFSSSSSKTSSSTKDVAKVDLSKSEVNDEVLQQMYDYHSYRLALNNRQTFLNGLCFNTFGIPYTLNYDSVDNTLINTFNPSPLNYYMIIVQNIIDNSFVKNLNRGFKDQTTKGQTTKGKTKDKKDDFIFDVEFDIDKDKKDSLVEKAKYILPILQKLEQRLVTYLSDLAKRSVNVDDYFQNLRQFWNNVLDESIIASHDNPLKYKKELELLRQKAEEALKRQLKVEQEEREKMLNAEQEAQRIIDEYKKKVLINDARDFVRQGEIRFKERQHNFSKQEWAQINVWFSYQFTKAVDIYESTLEGIGQLLDSTLSVPTNLVVNFTSTQISQIGKLLVLIGGVVIIGLMTLFLVKLFIWKVIKLFGFGEKHV